MKSRSPHAGGSGEDSRLGAGYLALLGAITALGSLGTHMFVPALPAAASELGASAPDMQLAIGAYLFGIGAGQLWWGPWIDSIGRRPILLFCTALFAAGSGVAAVSPTLDLLLGGRILQAFGASGAMVCSRTMVSDLSGGRGSASGLAALTAVVMISPALGPSAGGVIAHLAGWRWIFWTLALVALPVLLLAIRFTGADNVTRISPVSAVEAWKGYGRLLRDRRFVLLALGNAMLSGTLFHFLTTSPFQFQRLGFDTAGAGLLYMMVALSVAAGSVTVPAIQRLRPGRLVLVGRALLIAAAVGFALLAASGGERVMPLIAVMMIVGLASGISAPDALSRAQHRLPGTVGVASSLFGAAQMLLSGLVSASFSRLFSGGAAFPASLALLALLSATLLGLGARTD